MLRQAISRVRALSALDIYTAKSLAQQWEPALRLPSRPHEPKSLENENGNGPWFTTYSAFDPGCARPFLISGWSIGIKDISPKLPSPQEIIPDHVGKAVVKPDHKAVIKSSNKEKIVVELVKIHKP